MLDNTQINIKLRFYIKTAIFTLPEDGVMLRNVVNNKIVFFKLLWSL